MAGECVEHSRGDEPWTLTRCHNCGLLGQYEALEGWNYILSSLQFKGHKGENFLFLFYLTLLPGCGDI